MDNGSREKQEKRRIEAYQERCMRDFPFFSATDLLIDQKGGGRPIPFVLNREQQYAWRLIEEQMNSTGMVRYNILKGRQQGMSTMVAALFFWRCVTQYGIRALIVSKDSKATHSVLQKSNGLPTNASSTTPSRWAAATSTKSRSPKRTAPSSAKRPGPITLGGDPHSP